VVTLYLAKRSYLISVIAKLWQVTRAFVNWFDVCSRQPLAIHDLHDALTTSPML
jgi:hypothetical protein